MKKLILILFPLVMSCSESFAQSKKNQLPDGSYQVVRLASDSSKLNFLRPGQKTIDFDAVFITGAYNKVVVDTTDYVPMVLEISPVISQGANQKKLLSLTFSPEAAEKMRVFSAKRLMKEVVIVLDGKATTTHKIREAIAGNKMEITGCSDHACEYLRVKMENDVKK